MRRQRQLHRSVVIAISSVLFAVTASGSAMAWSGGSFQPTSASRVAASASPFSQAGALVAGALRATSPVEASASSPRRPTSAPVARTVAARAGHGDQTTKPPAARAPRPAPPTSHAPATSPGHRTIAHYLDAPGSQKAIDGCNLVLWTHRPLWLAAHNYCGYQWLAFVPTGSTVTVTSGPARGTFVVSGHLRLGRQSGALPRLSADLVLQTCIGSGTGLTLLRRV